MAVFVGRGVELDSLSTWADEVASTGVGRFVLVTGAPGIGKTRLCAEFSARLATTGALVAWSRCWVEGSGGPPLWPWPDVLSEVARGRGVPVDDGLAGEVRDRFALFRMVTDRLRSLCAAGPVVVLIDDLHQANHDVLMLTRFIARSVHRFPLLLVGTWRTEVPGARLAALSGDATLLELGTFGTAEVAAYLTRSGRDVAPGDVSELLAVTGGNPMYLAEVVRRPADDGSRAAGLADALAHRVAAVAAPRRQILGAVALLGEWATVEDILTILGLRKTDLFEAVASIASGAMVVGGRVRFSHELLRDTFAAAVAMREREQLHAKAADAIVGDGVDQVVRRAHHAVGAAGMSAGRRRSAVAACAQAAAVLRRALAFEQAVDWAARGALLAAGSDAPAVEAELLLVQAAAVMACGRLSEARELFQRAVAPAEESGDPRLLARAALGLGGVWVEEQRDELSRRVMLGLCRRALLALPADEPVLAARLRVRLAAEHAYGEGTAEDVGVAVAHVRRLGDQEALAEALSLYHHTLLLPDRAKDRLAVTEELLEAAATSDGTIYGLFGLCWLTVDLYLLGETGADRAFIDLRARATALGSRSIGYIVAVLDVMRTFRRGELAEVEAAAERALRLGVAVGDADALGYFGAHLLAIRWVQGRLGEMTETITSVLESATLRRRDRIYMAAFVYGTALRGDHVVARAALDALLADGLGPTPDFSTWTATVAVLVEAAAELGDGGLATDLAEWFAPYAHFPVLPSLAVVCLGPGERILGVAAAAAGRLDDAIRWFRSALEANRRLRSRPFDALIRAELAAVLGRRDRAGDRTEAAHLYATAIGLGREMGLSGRLPGWEAGAARVRPATVDAPIEPGGGLLERRSGFWHLDVDGRSATVADLVGLRHIAVLLARPDTDIPATELAAVAAGAILPPSGGAPVLDEEALRSYRRRLAELDRELDAADLTGDPDRASRAAGERALILDSLRRDTGLGGRSRRMPDEAERARMRVSRAIHRAIDQVSGTDPVLGRILATGIRTGYLCRYVTDPGRPIVWTVRT